MSMQKPAIRRKIPSAAYLLRVKAMPMERAAIAWKRSWPVNFLRVRNTPMRTAATIRCRL